MFFAPPSAATILAILFGAFFGLILPRPAQLAPSHPLGFRLPKSTALAAAAIFFGLLFLLPIADSLAPSPPVAVFNAFYRAGALVFGGGHVVLPLLENAVVARGWVDQQTFLSGYGAAQALPGPLFTFAAYLGASIRPAHHPVVLSALALIAIFLPGLLAVVAVLPFWSELRQRPLVQSVLRGVNAAVVGVLIAAFIRPVCSSALHSPFDSVVAVAALIALLRWKLSPWVVVIAVAALSALATIA
jgi:chromate transporter